MRKFILILFTCISLNISAQKSLLKTLDSLSNVYESYGYPGVILLAKGDSVYYEKAYGYADRNNKIKNTTHTLFKTESIGKMFTAVSIMQMVEKGKLNVEQTIADLLPDLKIKNAAIITVHQLLTHTSGLQSPWDHPNWNWKKKYSEKQLKQIIEEVPLVFEKPGKQFYYSNSGYIVLSWILEKLSGVDFKTYFKENIFVPQRMNSVRELNDTIMPKTDGAQPYMISSNGSFTLANETIGPQALGCGGWIATADDIYKFLLGLQRNHYFTAKTFELMKSANNHSPSTPSYNFYGYGLLESINTPVKGMKLYGHIGGGYGFSDAAFLDESNQFIIINFTNINQNIYPITINYLNALLQYPLFPIKKLY